MISGGNLPGVGRKATGQAQADEVPSLLTIRPDGSKSREAGSDSGSEYPTLNSITIRISKAANRSELLAVSQSIQNLPEHWQREQAGRIVKRKIAEFKQR